MLTPCFYSMWVCIFVLLLTSFHRNNSFISPYYFTPFIFPGRSFFLHFVKLSKSLALIPRVDDRVPIPFITLRAFHHICSSLSFFLKKKKKSQLIRAGSNFLNKNVHKALHSSANASHLYWEDVVCLILKPD